MSTVMWFKIDAELSDEEVARTLGSDLSIENGAGSKQLRLIRGGGETIGCRTSDNVLKVFLSKPQFVDVAKRRWKVAGTS